MVCDSFYPMYVVVSNGWRLKSKRVARGSQISRGAPLFRFCLLALCPMRAQFWLLHALAAMDLHASSCFTFGFQDLVDMR